MSGERAQELIAECPKVLPASSWSGRGQLLSGDVPDELRGTLLQCSKGVGAAALADEAFNGLANGQQLGVVKVGDEGLELLLERRLDSERGIPVGRAHAVARVAELQAVLVLLALRVPPSQRRPSGGRRAAVRRTRPPRATWNFSRAPRVHSSRTCR